MSKVNYIKNKDGERTAVAVPIDLWENLCSRSRTISAAAINSQITYTFDNRGVVTSSVVPIRLWNDLFAKPQSQIEQIRLDELGRSRNRRQIRQCVAM